MKAGARRAAESSSRRNALGQDARARLPHSTRHLSVQRDADWAPLRGDAAMLVRSVLGSPGSPLDPGMRSLMEPRLGHDFSAVRLHTDDAAAQSAQAVAANAYTAGNHIVFGAGKFAPATPDGQRLVAHELAHVMQQAHGPVPGIPTDGGMTVSQPADQFERNAAAVADMALSDQATRQRPVAELVRLPSSPPDSGNLALQRDAATTWGAIGAIAGIAALAVAAFAWLKPKNVNATAQGITMQPNPFQFSTLGDNAAAASTAPDAQSKFQAAAEGPPKTEKILEMRTDDDNDATFNLQSNADGNNIITANVVPGETNGYQGGYNGSIGTVAFSETQTFPPPKGAPAPAPQPAPAPPGQAPTTAGANPAPAASSPPVPAGGAAGGAPAPQVARAVIHFSGTNGKAGERLQTFGGEILVTADGALRCTRCKPTNNVGYGVESGTYGIIDYRSPAAPSSSVIESAPSSPGSPFPQFPNPFKDTEPFIPNTPVV
jgi:uncharacterized protein DUF4157